MYWRRIPYEGNVPTPEDVIAFLAREVKEHADGKTFQAFTFLPENQDSNRNAFEAFDRQVLNWNNLDRAVLTN